MYSMVRLRLIAMQPGSAVGYVTQLYDQLRDEEKVKLLINGRTTENIPTESLPKVFSSGKLIDVRAGELLGLGVAGSYYNLQSQSGKSYQVGVGLDDSAKGSIEVVLSDGTIWENETRQKMPYQQTMVQGLKPTERAVTTEEVIKAINDKAGRRADYPNNCGLILNIYSSKGQIDFHTVANQANLTAFQANLVISYSLPGLDFATVIRLEKDLTMQEIVLNSKRFRLDRMQSNGPWKLEQGI